MCYTVIKISTAIILYNIFFDLSSTKGVFFINLGKKILRICGYVVCGALMLLCVLLIIAALVFGSRETVNVFGFNIYMVQSSNISTAPKDSAVIVRKCSAFELNKGNLVLYVKDGGNETPDLGYVRDIETEDGTYFVTVVADGNETRFSDSDLIGRAEYSSTALGKTIAFIGTPWGVFFLAVIPCVVLIIYDILRAAAAKLPPPEVVPQIKNGDGGFEDEDDRMLSAARNNGSRLSVNGDGKATLSKRTGDPQQGTAADILFSYAARQKKVEEHPIIPLTDKKSEVPKPGIKLPEKPSSGYTSIININDKAKTESTAEPKTPNNVAVGRYAQNTFDIKGGAKPASEPRIKASGKTAELPDLPVKKDAGDAFFVQTDTPSFSEETLKRYSSSVSAPQLDANRGERTGVSPGRTARTARKRSTQIIASKSMDELFADDDDTRGRHRHASGDSVVNDILAEADRKK